LDDCFAGHCADFDLLSVLRAQPDAGLVSAEHFHQRGGLRGCNCAFYSSDVLRDKQARAQGSSRLHFLDHTGVLVRPGLRVPAQGGGGRRQLIQQHRNPAGHLPHYLQHHSRVDLLLRLRH